VAEKPNNITLALASELEALIGQLKQIDLNALASSAPREVLAADYQKYDQIIENIAATQGRVEARIEDLAQAALSYDGNSRQHISNEANMLLNAILGQLQAGSNAVAGQIGGLQDVIGGQAEGTKQHTSNELNAVLNNLLSQVQFWDTAIINHVLAQGQALQEVRATVLSELGKIASTSATRARSEVMARFLCPDLSEDECKLMNDYEICVEPVRLPEAALESELDWDRVGVAHMREKTSAAPISNESENIMSAYIVGMLTKKNRSDQIPVDPEWAITEIEVIDNDAPFPSVKLHHREALPGMCITRHYEFDVTSEFNSSHKWIYPPLLPAMSTPNITTRENLNHFVFHATARGELNPTVFRFPFPVATMAVKLDDGELRFEALVQTAQLLQAGRSYSEAIASVFQWTKHKLSWGYNTKEHAAIDTFRCGISGCGGVSDLAGVMLEMNSIRYRLVGGFNPVTRVWYPGGGHSAIEVWNGENWSYFDPYLDLYTENVAVYNFAANQIGKLPWNRHRPAPDLEISIQHKPFLNEQTLGGMFKCFAYADKTMRLPITHRVQLIAAEAHGLDSTCFTRQNYGLQWTLRPGFNDLKIPVDLPETQTIFVRARLLISKGGTRPLDKWSGPDEENAVFSDWAHTSFETRPADYARKLGLMT
jgi:hypothetical protein